MCDDAFTRICDLLSDEAMPVRALAAGMLGDFHSVSPQLLDQTLDKKLMSHLKVKMKLCPLYSNFCIHTTYQMRVFVRRIKIIRSSHTLGGDSEFLSNNFPPPQPLQGVKSDHERQKEQHAAGGGSSGFDTGRTWGSSIPKVCLHRGLVVHGLIPIPPFCIPAGCGTGRAESDECRRMWSFCSRAGRRIPRYCLSV